MGTTQIVAKFGLTCVMTTAPVTAMSKTEYLALAEQKYDDLQALATQPTFYDYEKSFEAIWMNLGRQVLERNVGIVLADRRKKDDDPLWSDSYSEQSSI